MRPKPRRHSVRPQVEALETLELLSTLPAVAADVSRARQPASIVGQLPDVTPTSVSTIPANGDLNPYGVAVVPQGFPRNGLLEPGDILVSNFNASSNLQGTGTTIVKVTPGGTQSLFFQGQAGIGLSTALGVVKGGFVLVGSTPTTDGTSATIQPGSILIINRFGQQVGTISDPTLLNGPWDLTVNDRGNRPQVFVSNVLSGAVTRLDLQITDHGQQVQVVGKTQIASGYTHRSDPAALEIGPTGLVFDPARNVLYVASTGDNAIFAVRGASTTRTDQGTGRVIDQDSTHLHGPLGLVRAPNGDLIAANGDAVNADPNQPSELVEFTPSGRFVAQFSLDPNPAGPFGIALASAGRSVIMAAVNDNHNVLELFRVHG
ncbi:MAG: hypothetical protein P4L84_31770 [Isosphaeraceae bacterium]|nr:hypothetical protein [Isosphaeraceae bacterium]